jgi:hypothetical protein
MPAFQSLSRQSAEAAMGELGQTLSLAERAIESTFHTLVARVKIPFNSTSPPGLVQANTVDPWSKSGKYGLSWVYFGIILLVAASLLYFYHFITDRIRTALHEDEVQQSSVTSSPSTEYEMSALKTDKSTAKFFPRKDDFEANEPKSELAFWAFRPFNLVVAAFRYVFYRPAPEIRIRKGWRPFVFPSISVIIITFVAITFSVLYCFIPQPLYWQSLQYGSPPLAIRSGMMAVAMMPWIVAVAMKANIISVMTGIGHERLNVLHRWGGYICLFLALVHTVPFYVQKSWDPNGYAIYQTYFQTKGLYIFGTGEFDKLPDVGGKLTRFRHCRIGTTWIPLHPLSPNPQTQSIRAFRGPPRSRGCCLHRHDVLALQELFSILCLPLRNMWHLGDISTCSPVLPQLDKSIPAVLACW